MIEIEERTLANGLRVVLAPTGASSVVAVNLWYDVGSRDDPAGRTGLAHLFEHLMFQGSAHVSRNGHFRHVERVGGSANATTWFDRTSYFQTLPARHLDLALWLESDRMGWMAPALTPEKLENQRDVVVNERRQRYDNQPYGDWDERVQALLFPPGHPYRHTVIGSLEDIRAAAMEDVRAFAAAHYRPDNAVLSIAGDVEPERAFGRVERYFGEVARPAQPPPAPPAAVEAGPGDGETISADVSAAVPLPRVYLAVRAPPFGTEAFYAGEVASHCLGAGRCCRLHDRLVRPRIAKSASCHLLPLTCGSTMFLVLATGFPGMDVRELEAAVARELDEVVDASEREVRRAVVGAETRTLRSLQRAGTVADLLSTYATRFGTAERLNEDLTRLERVSVEEVREWAARCLRPGNRVSVRYRPEDS